MIVIARLRDKTRLDETGNKKAEESLRTRDALESLKLLKINRVVGERERDIYSEPIPRSFLSCSTSSPSSLQNAARRSTLINEFIGNSGSVGLGPRQPGGQNEQATRDYSLRHSPPF